MNNKELRRETKARLDVDRLKEAGEDVQPLTTHLGPDELVGTHRQFMNNLNAARAREANKKHTQDTDDTSGKPGQ